MSETSDIANFREKLAFLRKFPEKEWLINGWRKDNINKFILQVYDNHLFFVKEGNYLELGCGTGILCKFLFMFSKGRIIPYGIDRNLGAIRLAKKKFRLADNFRVENYMELLRTHSTDFSKFSTISIFLDLGRDNWNRLCKTLAPILRKDKNLYFIIYNYDEEILFNPSDYVRQFISEVRKISCISVVDHNMLIIGGEKDKHIIAGRIREKLLKNKSYPLSADNRKWIIVGRLLENGPIQCSIKAKNLNNKKIKDKRLKIFFEPATIFTELTYYRNHIVDEKIIPRNTEFRKGDEILAICRKKERFVTEKMNKIIHLQELYHGRPS